MKITSWEINDEQIKNAEVREGFSGKHEAIIKSAVIGEYKTGTQYVDLRIAIPSRLNDEGHPKEYKLERMITVDGNGNPGIYFGIFQSAFRVLGKKSGTKPEVKNLPAIVYDVEEKAFIEKKVPQFVELLNKPIGVVIEMTQEYPYKYIDGYTKVEISKSERADCPYAISIPDYFDSTGVENKTFSKFSVKRFYCIDKDSPYYMKTSTEIIRNSPAKDVDKVVEQLKDRDSSPVMLNDSEINDLVRKKLKRVLAKLGEEFDEDRWVDYGSSSTEDVIPF